MYRLIRVWRNREDFATGLMCVESMDRVTLPRSDYERRASTGKLMNRSSNSHKERQLISIGLFIIPFFPFSNGFLHNFLPEHPDESSGDGLAQNACFGPPRDQGHVIGVNLLVITDDKIPSVLQ
jgi:hypothetical protein